MRVISVAVVGTLLLLLVLTALPRRAWARAAASLSPHALPDPRHTPRRPGSEGGEGLLAETGAWDVLLAGGKEQRSPGPPHPHGPLHPHQKAPDHRPDDDDDEEADDDDDDDDDEQDFEWSAEDLEVIKQKILDGLGLTSPPLRSQANVTKEEYDRAYREYQRLVQEERTRFPNTYPSEEDGEDEDEDDSEEEEDEEEEEEEEEEETTKSASYRFYSTGVSHHRERRGRRSTQTEGQLVHFHVAVPVRRVYHHDRDVKKATCRLWKTGAATPQDPASSVAVSLYRLNSAGRRRRRKKQPPRPVLLQTLNVSTSGDEWLSADVTEAVREWVRTPHEDAGVLVRCPECDAAGVTIHTGASASNTTHVPTLDVVTELPAGRRMKRSSQLRRVARAKRWSHGNCQDNNGNGGRRRRSNCCRRSMKVRFKDLPDFEFIESPEEFDAYYCSGRCPPRFNPANEHALLQSLLKLQRKKIPRPCCAPTKLTGLHILHLNKDGRITTTYWGDMVVTECGCA